MRVIHTQITDVTDLITNPVLSDSINLFSHDGRPRYSGHLSIATRMKATGLTGGGASSTITATPKLFTHEDYKAVSANRFGCILDPDIGADSTTDPDHIDLVTGASGSFDDFFWFVRVGLTVPSWCEPLLLDWLIDNEGAAAPADDYTAGQVDIWTYISFN